MSGFRGPLRELAGVETVSDRAPLALWPGAGEGRARSALLRAHPLLRDGVVTGPVFGHGLAYANVEAQRQLKTSWPVGLAVAGFADLARATRTSTPAADNWQLDAGIGLRVKVPGQKGALRVDVARGVRDGAHAFTIGWQY